MAEGKSCIAAAAVCMCELYAFCVLPSKQTLKIFTTEMLRDSRAIPNWFEFISLTISFLTFWA